jgi:hypothetical protein
MKSGWPGKRRFSMARNGPATRANKSKQEHNGRTGGTHERIDKESHT